MSNNNLMSFNIDKAQGFEEAKYRKLIEELRNLRKEITETISHEYVIPESEPCRWLDIQLNCGDCSITLRVDPRNLFVRGYSTNKDSEFWEFSDSSLINGSKSLPYSGSLLGLCSAAQGFHFHPGSTPVEYLKFILCGYTPLQEAIVNLGNQDLCLYPPHSARYLLCIILMITEAARIKFIADYVFESWRNPQAINIEIQSVLTAMSMGTFSGPNESYLSGRFISRTILKSDPCRKPALESIVCRELSLYGGANTVVSVYYVVLEDIYGGNKYRDIYGTVNLLDMGRKILHTVYSRTSTDFERKRQGEKLSLTTSFKLVDANDPFIIDVCLSDTYGKFAQGYINFHSGISPLDKHLERYVVGKRGKVGVGFSVIEFAVCAVIDVVIINNNHDVESSAHVYGNITASYHLINSESPTRLMLFEKSKNDCVGVSSQQPIPLTVRVFPVSRAHTGLTISVSLRDRDSLSLIPCGCLAFLPTVGTQLKNIIGEHTQVQVSFTCLPI